MGRCCHKTRQLPHSWAEWSAFLCSLICVACERTSRGSAWGCLFVLRSTCGQHTIVASVVERKDGSEFPSVQFVPFLLWRITKMENNRRVGPALLCNLDKERSSGSQTSKASFPELSTGAKTSSFLLKYFLVRLAVAVALFRANQT